MSTSFWNKCLGNINALRKVVKSIKLVHGPNIIPGLRLCHTLFDCIFYNEFCIYQYVKLEGKLESIEPLKQLQWAKQKGTFCVFYTSLVTVTFLER